MEKKEIQILGDDELGRIYDERNEEHQLTNLSLSAFPMLTQKTKFGIAYPKCTENIFTILTHHPDFYPNLRFDSWTNKLEIRRKKGEDFKYLVDSDYITIQRNIQRIYPQFSTAPKEMVIDAVNQACLKRTYDSAEDYIRGLTWDGKPRIENWLSMTFNIPKSDYVAAVGSNFFKGMAARITRPGCKFDTVLILVGNQGTFKSSIFSDIAGRKWYVETVADPKNKDFFAQMRGKLIIEFSEGETLSRSDVKHLKAVVSSPVDTYRPSYGRISEDFPRRCVFAMTTNESEFLKDDTGNRRYFPVEVSEKANRQWIIDNREQLFAEALYRIDINDEKYWEYPDGSESYKQQFMVRSQYEESIEKWLKNPLDHIGKNINIRENGLTISDVWQYALLGDKSKFTKRNEMEIGTALRHLGYEKSRRMVGNDRKNRWYGN